MKTTRRGFLAGLGAALATLALGRRGRRWHMLYGIETGESL